MLSAKVELTITVSATGELAVVVAVNCNEIAFLITKCHYCSN